MFRLDISAPRRVVRPASILFVAALLALAAAEGAGPVSRASAAGASSVYWGTYVPGLPADLRQLSAFESHAGKRTSIAMFGVPWTRAGVYTPFPQTSADAIRGGGTIPIIDWLSWDSLGSRPDQPAFQLAAIYNGNHDAYISQFARSAALWGKPFFIRFDPEMNGWWSPWSEQTNGNQPGDFIRAWRHVVDIFRQQGATNVTWVFCPNIIGPLSTPLSSLYPGDTYVDWMCLDGYNWGTDKGNTGWWSFTDVFAGDEYNGGYDSYLLVMQVAPTKPILIGETASSENGGSKAAWITSLLTTELPGRFPNIKGIVWFNWNVGDPGITWPIESSASAQAAFAQGIGSPAYAANQFGTLPSGPIQALSPLAGLPLVLNSVADTCSRKSLPTSVACGTSPTLSSDLTGTDTAFLRFDLASLAGKTVTSAKLRIMKSTQVGASSTALQTVRLVYDNAWKEAYLSYSNTVPISNVLLGTFTAPATSTWYQVDLPSSVVQSSAGSLLSMAIDGQGSDALSFDARESGALSAPQLVVAIATPTAGPPPSTPTPTATTRPMTPTAMATPVPATATATATPVTPGPTATSTPGKSTPTPTASTLALNSIADTCSRKSLPTSVACGTSPTLSSDLRGTDTAFLRFDLASLAGKTITSAKLRLRTSTEGWAGASVVHTATVVYDNAWKEAYLSFSNSVPISNVVLGSFTAPLSNTWYEVPFAVGVVQPSAGNLLSVAIDGQGSDVLIFYSRESAVSTPQLLVTYH